VLLLWPFKQDLSFVLIGTGPLEFPYFSNLHSADLCVLQIYHIPSLLEALWTWNLMLIVSAVPHLAIESKDSSPLRLNPTIEHDPWPAPSTSHHHSLPSDWFYKRFLSQNSINVSFLVNLKYIYGPLQPTWFHNLNSSISKFLVT
jgi:hypothetical protein